MEAIWRRERAMARWLATFAESITVLAAAAEINIWPVAAVEHPGAGN
jgi:hypothetical protein